MTEEIKSGVYDSIVVRFKKDTKAETGISTKLVSHDGKSDILEYFEYGWEVDLLAWIETQPFSRLVKVFNYTLDIEFINIQATYLFIGENECHFYLMWWYETVIAKRDFKDDEISYISEYGRLTRDNHRKAQKIQELTKENERLKELFIFHKKRADDLRWGLKYKMFYKMITSHGGLWGKFVDALISDFIARKLPLDK